MDKILLDIKEAALVLNVSVRTLQTMVKNEEIPFVYIKSLLFFYPQALHLYIIQNMQGITKKDKLDLVAMVPENLYGQGIETAERGGNHA